jgi:sterol 24-C-methyltransferase
MSQSYSSAEELASHDPVMRKLMHGKSSEERNAFLSMLKKDHKAHSDVTREYVGHWESNGVARDDDVARDQRKSNYASLVNKWVYSFSTSININC